jgi:alkanesulfonate monooxygenase SsuD/methylene tetrahydromethanopterin reductase-like flavin-dependent oxidoreductase (luciferase family)
VRIGIGLPTTTPGGDGRALVDWSRRAEEAGFTSLGVVDRTVYGSHDPLTTLAAAAAVTERMELVTMVVIGPIRNGVLLAKQAASIDQLSGGRLTLGLSIGARRDDYEAVGAEWAGRGERLSDQLALLREVWEDAEESYRDADAAGWTDDEGRASAIGPAPVRSGGPTLLVGGLSGASFLRAARYADGYVHNGGPPRAFASAAGKARAAWRDVGRPGEPVLWAQSYYALGDPEAGEAYMRDYYSFTGSFAERIVAGLLTSPEAVQDRVRGYAEAGCDEVVLLPATSAPEELDRLADVVL